MNQRIRDFRRLVHGIDLWRPHGDIFRHIRGCVWIAVPDIDISESTQGLSRPDYPVCQTTICGACQTNQTVL